MTEGLDQAALGAQVAQLIADATFDKYAKQFIKIEDERGQLVPFDLNEAQLVVYEQVVRISASGRPVKLLILKGRQQGMSTFSQCYLFWRCMTQPGTRALTVGHVLPAVHDLYRKFERAWKGLADHPLNAAMPIQPELEPGGEKGRRMLFADPLRSVYRADSATEPDGIGRGGTFNVAHLTEIPQWSKPTDTMQAVLACIPDHPESAILIETTAKGASGWFYEQWMEAQRKLAKGIEPEFYPVFVPWFKTKRYARPRREGEPPLDKRERAFRDKYAITNEQVYWYRDQRERYGDKVTEEYPSTWEEAFLSSGLPFFRRDAISFYRERRRKPQRIGQFRVRKTGSKTTAKFEHDDWGPTHIFEDPAPEHRYVVGVDFASGRAKDNSSIVVIDVDTKKVVCTHQSKLLPDDVLTEALLLARAYNNAHMIPERSGIGQALVDKLVNDWGYNNVYRENDPVAVKFHGGRRYGWATSNRTRQWLLEETAHLVHTNALDIPDGRIVDEMVTFVYDDEEGEHAAGADGCNDDMVMGLALACRGITTAPPPSVPTKVNYSPAISSVTGY